MVSLPVIIFGACAWAGVHFIERGDWVLGGLFLLIAVRLIDDVTGGAL